MSIRGRVGRHTQDGGRQCQNWADDQKTVTDLLNRIAAGSGGTAGSLNGAIRAGICDDALYAAISQFEDKYFPRQRSGYLNPSGPMLKRMEALVANPATASSAATASTAATAAKATQPAAENRLDILRRNVLDAGSVVANFHGDNRWTAGDRVQLDRLAQIAVRHIDGLKSVKDKAGKPLETLPWWGEMFGRVYVDAGGPSRSYGPDKGKRLGR